MKILAVNPGSTSTKIAVFEEDRPLFEKNVALTDAQRSAFTAVLDQLDMRCALISQALSDAGFAENSFDASVFLPRMKEFPEINTFFGSMATCPAVLIREMMSLISVQIWSSVK